MMQSPQKPLNISEPFYTVNLKMLINNWHCHHMMIMLLFPLNLVCHCRCFKFTPTPSTFTLPPTPRLTFCGWLSSLYWAVKLNTSIGGAISISPNTEAMVLPSVSLCDFTNAKVKCCQGGYRFLVNFIYRRFGSG